MTNVLTFLSVATLLIIFLATTNLFHVRDVIFYRDRPNWKRFEFIELVGLFSCILMFYPFFICLYLTVTYRKQMLYILYSSYNAFSLVTGIQFVPLLIITLLLVNTIIIWIKRLK